MGLAGENKPKEKSKLTRSHGHDKCLCMMNLPEVSHINRSERERAAFDIFWRPNRRTVLDEVIPLDVVDQFPSWTWKLTINKTSPNISIPSSILLPILEATIELQILLASSSLTWSPKRKGKVRFLSLAFHISFCSNLSVLKPQARTRALYHFYSAKNLGILIQASSSINLRSSLPCHSYLTVQTKLQSTSLSPINESG